MTLRQLCDEVAIDVDIVDIQVWNDTDEDYVDSFGFDTGSGDLGADILNRAKKDLDVQKALSYDVKWIGVEVESRKPVMRIEVVDPATYADSKE